MGAPAKATQEGGEEEALRREALRRALGELLGCGVGGMGPDGGLGRAVYDPQTGACVIEF